MEEDVKLERIYPFFIVDNLADSIDFYNEKLGFQTDLLVPEDDPFFVLSVEIMCGYFSNR